MVCLFKGKNGGGDSQAVSPTTDRDPADFAGARIDIRRLAQFLNGQQVNPTKVVCSMYISCGDI